MSGLFLLVACILLSAGASVFLKIGVVSLSDHLGVFSLLKTPMILVGGFFYAAAFLGYIFALRLVPLSLAQPVITAGVSIVTAFIATTYFREQMLPLNWAGLVLMCFGIFFLFSGRVG